MPVIVSNHGPSVEIVQKEKCGILVNYQDFNMVGTCMKELLTKKELVEKMGRNGRQAILKTYNWNSEKGKLLNLYEGFIDCI